jgi:hypothetical protein
MVVLVVATLAYATSEASAQPVISFHNPNPSGGGWVGRSVAAVGGMLLAGAPTTSGNVGAAYLFDATTGAVVRTLANPDPDVDDLFGWAAANVGGNAIVSAPGADETYLFDASTGALLQTFANPLPEAVAELGGNVLLGGGSGPVRLFDIATAAVLQTYASPVGGSDYFGRSVASVGSNVLVGAPFDDTGADDSGVAYLFDGPTGALLRTFANPEPLGFAWFGWDVAAVGDDVLVGAPRANKAYLIDGDSGTLLRTFTPAFGVTASFPSALAAFGADVLLGDAVRQRVALFSASTGALLRTLVNPTPVDAGGEFGVQIAVLDGSVVVGAPLDSMGGEQAGAAHRFCGGAVGCGPCETCGPAGSCVVAPHPACRTLTDSRGMQFRIRNTGADTSDAVIWRGTRAWSGPSDAVIAGRDYGNPADASTGHDYTLCMYDESGSPTLVFRMTAPAGGLCGTADCWRTMQPSTSQTGGYGYRDRERTPDGVRAATLRRAHGERTLRMTGAGTALSGRPFGLPTLPLNLPLRVQVQGREGICFDTLFSTAQRNTTTGFGAVSD